MTSRSPAAPSDFWPRTALQISYPVAGAIADWRALHSPADQSNTLLLHSPAFRPILRLIGYSALQQVRYTVVGRIVIIWELSSKLGTPAPLLSFLLPVRSSHSRPVSLFFHSNPANQICPALYSRGLNRGRTGDFDYTPQFLDFRLDLGSRFVLISVYRAPIVVKVIPVRCISLLIGSPFISESCPQLYGIGERRTILSSDEPSLNLDFKLLHLSRIHPFPFFDNTRGCKASRGPLQEQTVTSSRLIPPHQCMP